MDISRVPVGIKQCNPVNMFQAHGPNYRTERDNGLARFATIADGCENMMWWLAGIYMDAGRKSLPAMLECLNVSRNRDMLAYQREMVIRLRLNPLRWSAVDMKIDQPWCALDFCRAWIIVENGQPGINWNGTDEWCTPSMLMLAMEKTGRWAHI